MYKNHIEAQAIKNNKISNICNTVSLPRYTAQMQGTEPIDNLKAPSFSFVLSSGGTAYNLNTRVALLVLMSQP